MRTQLGKGIIIVSLGWHKIVQETGGLNNRHLCFYSSRGWKSDQGASMVSSVESSLSGLKPASKCVVPAHPWEGILCRPRSASPCDWAGTT